MNKAIKLIQQAMDDYTGGETEAIFASAARTHAENAILDLRSGYLNNALGAIRFAAAWEAAPDGIAAAYGPAVEAVRALQQR